MPVKPVRRVPSVHFRWSGERKAILGRLKRIDHFIMWEMEAVDGRPGTRVT